MADRMLESIEAGLDSEVEASDVLEALHRGLADHLYAHVVGDGVLVGTVHAAKGQEFGHVLVLSGGWNGQPGEARARKGGSGEQGRRLYYVAMTRARKTLTLLSRRKDPVEYAREMGTRVHPRRVAVAAGRESAVATRFATLGKREMFIDFASLKRSDHPVHEALARLQAGDEVTLARDDRGGVAVVDMRGVEIARLSKATAANWPKRRLQLIERVRVLGVVRRKLADCDAEEYRRRAAVLEWEYPVLEVQHHVWGSAHRA